MAAPVVDTPVDLSASPTSSLVITPPDDTHLTIVSGIGIGLSVSSDLRVQAGSKATGHTENLLNAGFDRVMDRASFWSLSNTAGVTQGFSLAIRGLRQAIPTMFEGQCMIPGAAGPAMSTGIQGDASDLTDFRIYPSAGGVMNAGTVYAVHYRRTGITIESHDFTVSPLTSKKFTGLSGAAGIYMVSSDLTFAVADVVRARVSIDGTTYDAGAADYIYSRINAASDADGTLDALELRAGSGRTAAGFAVWFGGFNLAVETGVLPGADMVVEGEPAAPQHGYSFRDAKQADQAIELFGALGSQMNGGKVYLMRVP